MKPKLMNNTTVKMTATNFLHRVNTLLVSSRLLLSSTEPSHHPITAIFLNSICLELIIKTFLMIEKNKESPYTHDVYNLFTQLNDKTKDYIEKTFYDDEYRKKEFNKLRNLIRTQKNEELPEEDFTEILKNCEDIIKNLKYNQSSFSNVLGGQHLNFLDTLRIKLSKKLQDIDNKPKTPTH